MTTGGRTWAHRLAGQQRQERPGAQLAQGPGQPGRPQPAGLLGQVLVRGECLGRGQVPAGCAAVLACSAHRSTRASRCA
jgi:hypothetical protein